MSQIIWFVVGVLVGLLLATWYAIVLAHTLSDRFYNRQLQKDAERFKQTVAGYRQLARPGTTGELAAAIDKAIDEVPHDVLLQVVSGSLIGMVDYLSTQSGVDQSKPVELDNAPHRNITIHPKREPHEK